MILGVPVFKHIKVGWTKFSEIWHMVILSPDFWLFMG